MYFMMIWKWITCRQTLYLIYKYLISDQCIEYVKDDSTRAKIRN
jgi:hypothetical protein